MNTNASACGLILCVILSGSLANAQDDEAAIAMAKKAQDPLGDVRALMTDNTIAFDGGPELLQEWRDDTSGLFVNEGVQQVQRFDVRMARVGSDALSALKSLRGAYGQIVCGHGRLPHVAVDLLRLSECTRRAAGQYILTCLLIECYDQRTCRRRCQNDRICVGWPAVEGRGHKGSRNQSPKRQRGVASVQRSDPQPTRLRSGL